MMMSLLRRVLKIEHDALEHLIEDARLEDAERRLDHLRKRAARATGGIEERHRRNHWQEAIDELIREARKP